MNKNIKTPGVYINEMNSFGSSIVSNATAVPVFIGFTEFFIQGNGDEINLINGATIVHEPVLIQSVLEYQNAFGGADLTGTIDVTSQKNEFGETVYSSENTKDGKSYTPGFMEPSVVNFFSNGGAECYIVSLGKYEEFNFDPMPTTITNELNFIEGAIQMAERATLILPTDLIRFATKYYYAWGTQLTNFAGNEKKYFAVLDTIQSDPMSAVYFPDDITQYRENVNSETPSYAGAYFPYLKSLTTYAYKSDFSNVNLDGKPLAGGSNDMKEAVKAALAINYINMPASPFMAGIYSRLDNSTGVWTPPANVSPIGVRGPLVNLTNREQEDLNVDVRAGKSINAIRSFTGKGTLIWGARTNDGNSLDWRYINVRRLFISIETDISSALEAYVFKPNVHNTWVEVKTMIESYLLGLYGSGAFAGMNPETSYQVLIGVGTTMTDDDVLNGIMRVSIMVAPVRPAEFIVLTFVQMVGQ